MCMYSCIFVHTFLMTVVVIVVAYFLLKLVIDVQALVKAWILNADFQDFVPFRREAQHNFSHIYPQCILMLN